MSSTVVTSVPVPGEHLVAHGKPLGRHHQPDVHLLAVRALVPAVATGGLLVALGLALEVGAGDVVKQKLEAYPEQTLVALLQVLAERILVRKDGIEPPDTGARR
jgi:hypothetical protein